MNSLTSGVSHVKVHVPGTSLSSERLSARASCFSDRVVVPSSRERIDCRISYDLTNQNDFSGGLYTLKPLHRRKLVGQTFCSAGVYNLDGITSEVYPQAAEERIGILLLNLGGPETLDDVQPFLFNLFADPDIIRLPRLFRFLQRPLAQIISFLRAPKSKEGYASIGGGSPLRQITDEQARALKNVLEAKRVHAKVYVGMRYWHPFTEDAVKQIKKDRITKLVVLPLYPQFSISTTGSSIRVLQDMFREDEYLASLPVTIIESWYRREGYVNSMASLIEKELQAFSNPEEAVIFFSAHGVPVSYVEDAGDPYKEQMEDCVSLIMSELRSRKVMNDHTLAYQSRVGPVEWLKPYTDEVIVELGQKGVKNLLVVPVSFVSEHIETLEEMDMEYKELALESGVKNWRRVPALGCKPEFISDLADAAIEALPLSKAMYSPKVADQRNDPDVFRSALNLLLGSFMAFFLLLGPKFVSSFRGLLQ
ncbi:unnamed protein product [Victoria cruziana]